MIYSQLSELSGKYNLTQEEISITFEEVVSDVMAKVFKADVDCHFNNEEIYIYGDSKRVVPIRNINKSIVRLIRAVLLKKLYHKSALKEFETSKNLTNTVVGGYVSKISRDRVIYVEIDDDNISSSVYGVCRKVHQPPKERGNYKLGHYYRFHTNKVIFNPELSSIEISLSRTSKKLVSGLLKKELLERFIDDVEVVCSRRIAGVLSEVKVTKRIPRECITAVSKELKERIIVTF